VGALTGAVRTAAAVAAGTTQRSIRRHLCPPELQARAQQTWSGWSPACVRPAALVAGAIAAAFSMPAALLVGTALYLVPAGPLWSSPVPCLTAMPAPPLAKDGPHVP
jgi:hypothetical protein